MNEYEIELKRERIVNIKGKGMFVNGRGDLLITETKTTTYDVTKVVACFHAGSWVRAEKKSGE